MWMILLASSHAGELGLGVYGGAWALPEESVRAPSALLGGRLRYRFSDNYAIELGAGTAAGGIDPRVEILRFMPNDSLVTPFIAVGGGLVAGGGDTVGFGGLGGGVDAELAPWIDFRTDLRLRILGESKPTAAFLFDAGLQLHTARVHDTDKDGVNDKSDACKTEPEDKDGFSDADGCPDLDNDGDSVVDSADTCPDVAEDADGYADADGCVDPDNDGDGVLDGDDRCISVAEDKDGFQDTDGCVDPDNDGDGVLDGADSCISEPESVNGFNDKDGCPDEVPAEVQKFSGVIQGVNFETGKATLLPSSSKILDEAAGVLLKFTDIRLEVQGHTDDVGDDAKNLTLSQNRAQSVVDYLVAKGVSRESLVAKGYGETAPKVANDNKANRAVNRRVEFKRL